MDNFFQTRNNIGKDNRCRSRALEYGGKFMYQIRTDLALETQEKMQEDHVDLKGVRFLEEKVDKNITVSTVVIETENGAKTMGKPKGTYITIEAGNMDEEDEDYHREISVQLAKIIRQLIQKKNEELSVLVVGLGNREVTPDALGPRVVDNLFITRHIVKEYGKYAFGEKMSTGSAVLSRELWHRREWKVLRSFMESSMRQNLIWSLSLMRWRRAAPSG